MNTNALRVYWQVWGQTIGWSLTSKFMLIFKFLNCQCPYMESVWNYEYIRELVQWFLTSCKNMQNFREKSHLSIEICIYYSEYQGLCFVLFLFCFLSAGSFLRWSRGETCCFLVVTPFFVNIYEFSQQLMLFFSWRTCWSTHMYNNFLWYLCSTCGFWVCCEWSKLFVYFYDIT